MKRDIVRAEHPGCDSIAKHYLADSMVVSIPREQSISYLRIVQLRNADTSIT